MLLLHDKDILFSLVYDMDRENEVGDLYGHKGATSTHMHAQTGDHKGRPYYTLLHCFILCISV